MIIVPQRFNENHTLIFKNKQYTIPGYTDSKISCGPSKAVMVHVKDFPDLRE